MALRSGGRRPEQPWMATADNLPRTLNSGVNPHRLARQLSPLAGQRTTGVSIMASQRTLVALLWTSSWQLSRTGIADHGASAAALQRNVTGGRRNGRQPGSSDNSAADIKHLTPWVAAPLAYGEQQQRKLGRDGRSNAQPARGTEQRRAL